MKIIKIIDLLNMIANGENIKNIKYQSHIYEYYNGDYREKFDGAYDSNWLFANEIIDLSNLNDEVEIIEEDNNKITPQDVENLGYACNTFRKCFEKGWKKCEKDNNKIEKITGIDTRETRQCIIKFQEKFDEIIDKINNM